MKCEFCGIDARYIPRIERWIVCEDCESASWFSDLLDSVAKGDDVSVVRLVEKHSSPERVR